MGKASGKTYTITEKKLEAMLQKASAKGAEAYRKESEETRGKKFDRMLYRTKTLLEKYTKLNAYAENAIYTIESAEKVNQGIADMETLMKFGIFDDDKTLHRMERGVTTVKLIMTHVNNMLSVYREECYSSSNEVKRRQYDVIEAMYLLPEKKSTRELAEMYHTDDRTIRRYAESGREDLTVLIFGIEAMAIRLMRD